MHDLASTCSLALQYPLDIGFLPVGSRAGSFSSLSRLGVRMNVDGYIGQSPSQSTKTGTAPHASRSWSKRRFSVHQCHGNTNPNVQLVNDLNTAELFTIDFDSHTKNRTTRLIYGSRIYEKAPSECLYVYTPYNGTCGNSEAPGTHPAFGSLPLSMSRSCDGIQGAQYHQTIGQTRKAQK